MTFQRPAKEARARSRPSADRTPRAWLLAPFALAALAVAYWALGSDGDPEIEVLHTDTARHDTATDIATATEAVFDKTDHGARTLTAEAATEETPKATTAPLDPTKPPREHVVIRVVDGRTMEPVPGATVAADLFLRKNSADRAHLTRRLLSDFDLNLRTGQVATTDANGYVSFKLTDGSNVGASKGELFVATRIDFDDLGPDGAVLRLQPVRSLAITVVGIDGNPLADVPLGLQASYACGEMSPRNYESRLGSTGDDGTLTVRLEEFLRPGSPPRETRLYFSAPGLTKVRVPIASDQTAVTMTLPAAGSVRVHVVDRHQQPLADAPGWWVQLRVLDDDADEGNGQNGDDESRIDETVFRWGKGGEVVFPYVGLGLQLHRYLGGAGMSAEEMGPGPTQAGQEVVSTMSLAAQRQFSVQARILDPSGTPMANATVDLNTREGNSWVSNTDAEGRLLFCSQHYEDAPTTMMVRASAARDGEAPCWCEPFALDVDRPLDLGDLAMRSAAVVARGRVVHQGRMPPGLQLHVQQFVNDDWTSLGTHRVQLAEDDTFAVVRTVADPDPRLRLIANAPGFQRNEPMEFAPGRDDLVVELKQGTFVSARLQLDPAVVWFVENSGLDLLFKSEAGHHQYVRGELQNGEWVFDTNALPKGIYSIAVESGTATDDLAHIDAVRVMPGEPTDPRLQPWDLRSTIQLMTVRTRTPEGQKLEVGGDISRRRRIDGEWEGSGSFERGVAQFLTTSEPVELFAEVSGYGPFLLSNVQGAVDLVLAPPRSVTIHVDDLPPLRTDVEARLVVSLVTAEGWGKTRGLVEWASAVIEYEWDPTARSLRAKLAAGAQVAIHFGRYVESRGDYQEEELALFPIAIPDDKNEVHVTLPDAARAALSPWFGPPVEASANGGR